MDKCFFICFAVCLLVLQGCVSNNGSDDFSSVKSPADSSVPVQRSGLVFDEQRTEYDNITIFAKRFGELVYLAAKDGKTVAVNRGEELGKDYDSVIGLVWADGIIGFRAIKDGKRFVVYNGSPVGSEYDEVIKAFRIVDGKKAFIAVQNGKNFVVYDGNELGKEYDSVTGLAVYGGKLAYTAWKGGKPFIVFDGKEIPNDYDYVELLPEINTSLAYIAVTGSSNIIYYNGTTIGLDEGYDWIYLPVIVNGKLAYQASVGNESFLVYDGVKIYAPSAGEKIGGVYQDVGGMIAYNIVSADGKQYVAYDGKTFGKGAGYDSVYNYDSVNGKLLFVAVRGERTFIVFDGKEIGQEYDPVTTPQVIDGKIMFAGEKDGVWYILKER
jgi:hypothetical protein